MAKKERKVDFVDEGPDLAPGFFSSYGYGEGCTSIRLLDEETGKWYYYTNGGRDKVYVD